MNTLRWPRFWMGLWIFGMLLGCYLSLRPGTDRIPIIPHLDKLIHASGYALLAVLAVGLFAPGRSRWLALLWLLALGGLIEIAQGMLPTGRMMEAADFAANTIGAGIGAALFWRRNALVMIERIFSRP